MNKPQIEFSKNEKKEITISVRKSSLFTRIVLFIIFVLFVSAPILGLAIMLIDRMEIKFGIFISFGLFWGLGYYVFRLFSWNSYGKELISFNESVQYYSDFKYFKDSHTEFNNDNLTFDFEEIGYFEDNQGILIIKGDEHIFKSVIKVKTPELEETIERLKNYA